MEEGLLKSILDDNQIEFAKFTANPSKFLNIECFHFNLPVHPRFNPFVNIEELRVIEQDVVDLNWLEDVPHLTTLIVFHTQLRDSTGLKFTPLLKKLILERSKLTKFPDISNLKQIEHLSVSTNPIKEITFPKCNTIKILDISSCGLHSLSNTLLNIPNLQTLLIGGNRFHDFSILDVLSKLDNLVELNIYDPNYGDNPICTLPNYNVISLSMLPQVTFLDTYKVTDRIRQAAIQKKADTRLYYIAKSASDMSEISTKYSELARNASAQVSKITSKISVNSNELARIYSILDEAEFISNTMNEFYRLSSMLSFDSGGTILFNKIEDLNEYEMPSSIKILSDAKLTAVWNISHLPLLSLLEEGHAKLEKTDYYVKLPSLEAGVSAIQEWTQTKSFDKTESFCVDETVSFCLYCKHSTAGFVPDSLMLFSIPFEEKIAEIDNLVDSIEVSSNEVKQEATETSLVTFKGNFDLTESLVTVNLVDCNIQTLQIFDGMMNLEKIIVPFNEIPTIADVPMLPKLEVLDVSFNKISDVQQLVISSAAVSSNIKEISIYGNPVCEPKSIRFIMNLYPNSEKIFKVRGKSLFIPPNCDNDTFLSSINAISSITVLDLRRLCISTLAPLSDLPQLTTLFASGNDLTTIDFQSDTLEYADFSENKITDYPRNDSFPRLHTLLLNGNQLNSFTSLSSVCALFVGDNNIEELPSSDDLPVLEVLFILGNPVAKSFPDSRFVFALQTLKMLNGNIISPQQRQKINKQFAGVLFFEDIPKILQPKQTTLDLSNKEMRDVNALTSQNLASLDLSNNLIASIDWMYNSVPHLQQLLLQNNQLQALNFITAVPKIKVLNLSGNKLSDAHLDSLCAMKLPHLTSLGLANNNLKRAPMFYSFQSLESIDVSHNFIATVDKSAFECPTLKILNLGYNSLRKLDNVGVPSLLSLDVSHNRITSADEVGKLRICQKILKFWFNDNPLSQRIVPRIRCLCMLQSLQEMDSKMVTESDLSQVRILLEQSGASLPGPSPAPAPMLSGRGNSNSRVNNVIIQPGLPQLNPSQGQRGTKGKSRYPR
ncbi:hypothetical protein TRFO_10073 [Tritrichomonas foetus]|uniref:Leucine Rich Repeat family protein n=1 Tax=Tritrichomonas foetus TaxID=1144522 RepID=A0A1J4JAF9_9EUKA|nr:hypothetical protein TRFO_10073 [Tritrichomonas foetus]|eukprot:OHS96166.1 hypothetical protein TRFO_10073 [Tritrichomonas foetus]